jgi:4-alpha-glucanotransferase
MVKRLESKLKRGAGILLPVSALPSPYGIGTLGREACVFVDFLKDAGFSYWQVLPVGPSGYGDSPYQSFSAFAGNPYYIDLDILIEEGLLDKEDTDGQRWFEREDEVDYNRLFDQRFLALKKAFSRSRHEDLPAYLSFCREHSYWLEDYSLFMAVKEHFEGRQWLEWDEDIRLRRTEALEKYRSLLKSGIDFWKFCQFKFYMQWQALKNYANEKGVLIIGDIPIYVSLDSCDIWVHNRLFELDGERRPVNVAGVPPDAFCEIGQRWGNPLYNWNRMEQEDFAWWRERMRISASLYDCIRIDHFIGIVNYYSIPGECRTAREGRWIKGPGSKLTDAILESIGNAKIIAEDLGVITPQVRELMSKAGFPGMKVVEFALEGPTDNEYLPRNYKDDNTVVYTGTHDNDTLAGCLEGMDDKRLEFAYGYFKAGNRKDLAEAIIKAVYSCIADVVIFQMQDLLGLGSSARINTPATIGGNWKWRLLKKQYEECDKEKFLNYSITYERIN